MTSYCVGLGIIYNIYESKRKTYVYTYRLYKSHYLINGMLCGLVNKYKYNNINLKQFITIIIIN